MNKIEFEKYIKTYENFPKKNISFKDISPLLLNINVFNEIINIFVSQLKNKKIDKIIGIDARGFIFGIAIATKMNIPFIMARKSGKLPGKTISEKYIFEYGENIMEIQEENLEINDKIAIVDDVLATGSTANAIEKIVIKKGGNIEALLFLIEIKELNGRKKIISKNNIFSLLKY